MNFFPRIGLVTVLALFGAGSAEASLPKKTTTSLNERLTRVRAEVVNMEQSLIESLGKNKEAKENLRKIQDLIHLQKE